LRLYDSAMPREQAFEGWEQEQRERDPSWDRRMRDFQRVRGPRRKVPLLLDENLEAEIINDLQTIRDFRVTVGSAGAGDPELWDQARTLGAVLVTTDGDFWNDRNYPLAQSPGVIIVSGQTASEKGYAFALAVVRYGVIEHWRKVPGWLRGMKLRATREGIRGKWWDGTSVIRL
jgi:predicted nuclease of predicted toxin-antitoxin system